LSKEAKIGLLLGLVFIVAIAVVLRGVHRDSLTISDESAGLSKSQPEASETVPLSSVVEQLSSEHRPTAEHKVVVAVSTEPQASAGPASVAAPVSVPSGSGTSGLDSGQVRFVGELPGGGGGMALAITQEGLTSDEQSYPGPIIMPPSGAIERAVANISQQRAAVSPVASPAVEQSRKYEVRKGDDLSSIAIKYYGQEAGNKRANIERIFNANRETMHSINEIQIGQQLVIPQLEAEASGSSKTPDAKISSQPGSHKEKYYVVQEGDSLWSIAARKLGDGKRFNEIVKLNGKALGDKNNVYPGMKLRMP